MEKKAATETGAKVKREGQIVLIVDPDITRQFITTVVLQRLRYQVFPVKTAEEALLISELTVPMLIITEIALPQMSGIDLLKCVKQNPHTRDVPVIIYTALSAQSYRDECARAGCSEYLAEPADHNKLYVAIQKVTETTPRHFVRLDTSLDAVVEGAAPDGGQQTEKVTALSEHGMFVSTLNPLPSGTVIPFTLFLDRAMAWGIGKRVEGKVLSSQAGVGPTGKLPGMSIKFEHMRPEDRDSVRAFIRENLLSGLAKGTKRSRK